ncbi:MAG: DNA-protecting protein DprA [Deltaproteobacteria bacterium]|nr:DNA-protecting protein DprA [Deltaproteobacteria bacterium]
MTSACSDYPVGLRDLSDAPERFRIVGELPDLRRAVSIVGTRRADDEALDFAYSVAREAVLNGLVVVSGGAIGVDRAAHEGAIDGGGRTVVVLPTGLDSPYPRANHHLFERAVEAGCLLTEVEDGAAAQPGRFLTRNRLIAALGRSTVVVQAPARSGALSTASAAKRLSRPVFAVPASPWDPRGSGNLRLLRNGARICTGPADVRPVPPRRGPVPTHRNSGVRGSAVYSAAARSGAARGEAGGPVPNLPQRQEALLKEIDVQNPPHCGVPCQGEDHQEVRR